jgi:hypothetical protein
VTAQAQVKLTILQHSLAEGWSALPSSGSNSERTLVLVFGSSRYREQQQAIRDLAAALPDAARLGCSSAGEILGARVQDGSLVAAVMQFEHAQLKVVVEPIDSQSSFEAGQRLARDLVGPELRAVFVLSEGVDVNGSELTRGVNSVLPAGVMVCGGLAGDGERFERTWVLEGSRLVSQRATAVGFYGPRVHIGHGARGGWDIFGPERVITRSRGNVLYELDGAPALPLYKRYLGERARGLPATALLFPLAIRDPLREERRVVRTVLAIDEAAGSLRFAGDVPEGHRAQLMHANFDRLIQGASDAGLAALPANGPSLAIAISCIGRRLVLRDRAEEELEAALLGFPRTTQQIGFYSYGEISPLTTGRCDLQNQTITLTSISED